MEELKLSHLHLGFNGTEELIRSALNMRRLKRLKFRVVSEANIDLIAEIGSYGGWPNLELFSLQLYHISVFDVQDDFDWEEYWHAYCKELSDPIWPNLRLCIWMG